MARAGLAVWRTTAARFAAVYAGLFLLAMALGLGSVYVGTIGVLERQVDATLAAEVRALEDRFRSGGLVSLSRAIEARTGPDARGGNVYLLMSPQGRVVSGNLSAWPEGAVAVSVPGPVSFRVTKRDGDVLADREVRARIFDLSSGFQLLVGRDSEDLEAFRQRFFQVVFWVGLGAVLFGLLAGLIPGRRVLARVEAAADAGHRIAGGDLARRLPVSGTGDEFDRLAGSVNAMLDRIEALMSGMRLATDSISHDLRRPLTRARADLELALLRSEEAGQTADGAGSEADRAAMTRALAQVDAAVSLLGDLLTLARAEAMVPGDGWSTVDLADLAREAVDLYAPVAEERGVALTLEAAQAPLRGEPQLLAQALTNLIDNALKYAPAGTGAVAVRVSGDSTGAGRQVLEVADNGPGIPRADRGRVCNRFVRLDTARGESGAGLGLSLVQAVAKLHGGTFDLGDAQPGLIARVALPGVPLDR